MKARGSFMLGVLGLTVLVACAPELTTTGGTSGNGGAGGNASGSGGGGGLGGDGAGGSGGASSSSSSSASGTGGGPAVVCPDVPDTPPMVAVQAPAGGKFYCIDSTEVTNAAYLSWAKTMPTITQPPQCEWNTSLLPPTVPPENNLPMANVDWCDAYAYCAAHEKRLCGRIGGGPLPFSEHPADEALSQWYNVCTAGGTRAYPHGDTYDPAACNGQDKDAADDKPLAVGLTTCEGGFLGIFDLSGNVWEWEDSCADDAGAPAEHPCRRRGGGYSSKESDLDCSTASPIARASANSQTGFRCCSDLP